MMTYKITMAPVSPGTSEEDGGLKPGDGTYQKRPEGPNSVVMQLTDAQMTGVRGYLILIKRGADTSSVESTIAGLAPT